MTDGPTELESHSRASSVTGRRDRRQAEFNIRQSEEPPSVAYPGEGVYEFAPWATWRSGYATVCKTVYTSSILVVASIH